MAEASNYSDGFCFILTYSGEDTVFQEVSGISLVFSVTQVESVRINQFVQRVPKSDKSSYLILKKGILAKDSKLITWCERTLNEGLTNAIVTYNISLKLINTEGAILKTWRFVNTWPVKYSISNLDANSIAIETIEFAYLYLDVV